MENSRGSFGSKLGVILATAGSAVGLGNIWRFPYMTGQNGGAAFILIYLVCIFMLGIPGMVAEFIIGRHSAANAARSYKNLSNGKPWGVVGYMGVFTSMIILGFYAVVAGWCLQYLYASIMAEVQGDANFVKEYFASFSSDAVRPTLWTIAFILLTHVVVVKGVRNGIERASKILMPLLFVLLVVLVVASCSLQGAWKGVEFLLKPDFSKVDPNVMIEALGQAFFSLSLGTACLCTYASYFSRQTNLLKTATQIASMPVVGYVISVLFYALLVLAALTSTISMHEIGTAFFYEEMHISRRGGAWIETVTCCVIGIFCALSCGAVPELTFFGKSFLNCCDNFTAQWLMPMASFFTCIFVGWYIPKKVVHDEFTNWSTLRGRFFGVYLFMVRFVCPLCILIIFLHQLGVL